MKSIQSSPGFPSASQRKQTLRLEAISRGLMGDVDFDFVARQTFGLTDSDLASAVQRAAFVSQSNDAGGSINTSDLLEGVRKVAISPGRQGSIYGPHDKKKMAFAAAGRAVVAAALGRHKDLKQVCLLQPENLLTPPGAKGTASAGGPPGKIPEWLVLVAAGKAAEKLFFGEPAAPFPSPDGQIEELAAEMQGHLGRPSPGVSKAAEECAAEIVSTYRTHVEAMASRLETEEVLAGPHLQSMLEAVRFEAKLFGPPCSLLETVNSNSRSATTGR